MGDTTSIFDRVINIGGLRPKEPKHILVWTNTNEVERIKKALINYKNGSENVDFGIQAYGIWEKILLLINQFWILVILIPILGASLLLAYISDKKQKGNVISPSSIRVKNKI